MVMKNCKRCGTGFSSTDNINPISPYCSNHCFNEDNTCVCKTYVCKTCGKKWKFADQEFCHKKNALEISVDVEQNNKVDKVLKDEGTPFQRIKEKIRMARKSRMRTVQMLLCDYCDEVILKPEDGFIIHGNIYVADPVQRGGLIGNNFPEEGTIEQVHQTVLCRKCFMKSLDARQKPPGPIPRHKSIENILANQKLVRDGDDIPF